MKTRMTDAGSEIITTEVTRMDEKRKLNNRRPNWTYKINLINKTDASTTHKMTKRRENRKLKAGSAAGSYRSDIISDKMIVFVDNLFRKTSFRPQSNHR